jgi:hypothetical protein
MATCWLNPAARRARAVGTESEEKFGRLRMAVSVLVESDGIVTWTCQADIKPLQLLHLERSAQAFPPP